MSAGHFAFSSNDYWFLLALGAILLAGGVKKVRAREAVAWVRWGRVIRYSGEEVVVHGGIAILIGAALLISGLVGLN